MTNTSANGIIKAVILSARDIPIKNGTTMPSLPLKLNFGLLASVFTNSFADWSSVSEAFDAIEPSRPFNGSCAYSSSVSPTLTLYGFVDIFL